MNLLTAGNKGTSPRLGIEIMLFVTLWESRVVVKVTEGYGILKEMVKCGALCAPHLLHFNMNYAVIR